MGRKSNIEIIVNEISEGFKGVIVDKYAPRDTQPTHLKIRISETYINVSPYREIVERASIGDSIIKPKNENYIYLIKPDGRKTRIFYTKISYETRKSKFFPEEWKDKWLESSAWDQK
ncbi:hypothetical protein [Winogradskyella sp.]|uniref:hypothetical protein n=1 Tax=Winogradskyella sp. TaxID=1883156 RepID=UPI0026280CFC|nr:hypothetical protein [Winogradskyella sp.]